MGWSSSSAFAGVAMAAAVFLVINGIPVSVAQSYQIRASQAVGAEAADTNLALAYQSARRLLTIVSIACLALLLIGAWPLMHFLIAGDATAAEQGTFYLIARGPALLLAVPAQLRTMTFAAHKQTMRTLQYVLITAATNVALDILLVIGLGLGALGNGLATLVAAAVGNYIVRRAWRCSNFAHLADAPASDMSRRSSEAAIMWRLSHPLMLAYVLDYAGTLLMFAFLRHSESSDIAGMRLAYTLMMCMFGLLMGYATAMQILLSRNMGIGRRAQHRQATSSGLVVLIALSGIGAVLLITLTRRMLELLTNIEPVRNVAAPAMLIVGLSLPIMGLSLVFTALVRSRGATNRDFQTNTLAVWAVQLPLTVVLFTAHWGPLSIFYGLAAYWLARCLFLAIAAFAPAFADSRSRVAA